MALNRLNPSADSSLEETKSAGIVSPKTILFYDHIARMSGGEIALMHLVRALDQKRYKPVVVLGAEGPLRDKLEASGIVTHVLPLDTRVAETRKDTLHAGAWKRIGPILQSLAYARRLAAFIRSQRADLIHTNSLKADILGGIAGRLARVPVLWHVRDRIADEYLPGPAARLFRFLCRRLPSYVVTNSASTLATLFPAGSKRARVVHDGIPDPHLPVSLPIGSADTALVGLVGRISPWKGQHVFLDAAALVLKKFPHTRFQIIGSALFSEEEYEAKVRAQANNPVLQEHVEFTGFCEDIFACIQRLDILVHASTIGEPFGQVVVEGMLAGKPVIATNGGGIPEIVLDGETGILVPMGDADAMAEAICQCLVHPERAQAMGQAGKQRAQIHFSIENTARNMERVYDQFWK